MRKQSKTDTFEIFQFDKKNMIKKQAPKFVWDYCRICYTVMDIQTDESEKKLHATMITW